MVGALLLVQTKVEFGLIEFSAFILLIVNFAGALCVDIYYYKHFFKRPRGPRKKLIVNFAEPYVYILGLGLFK